MPGWSSPPASRRAVLATGAASIASLAGCSALASDGVDAATLDRIVLRSDTGRTERVELTLVYAPRDSATQRPVRGVRAVAGSSELLVVDDFEGDPGFYSLTAASEDHGTHGVYAFNSYGPSVGSAPLQFEVVVRGDGDIWLNLDEAGAEISIPG